MIDCIEITSTSAALLGALIGSASGVIVTLINARATEKKETKSFRRSNEQKHIDAVSAVYSEALKVIFAVKKDGNPNPFPSLYGEVPAQISLFGSNDVQNIVNEFIGLENSKKPYFDTNKLIAAMKRHIEQMQSELK